jgi:tRNA pseudouridine55 synthase
LKLSDILNGSIILIDKVPDWTSFDIVNKIKYFVLNNSPLKKFKIGHAGTLDPFATGLLIIASGKKTKEIDQFVAMKKSYFAEFYIGQSTDSYDKTGIITESYHSEMPKREDIEESIQKHFMGEIEQVAPMFSAKKVNGKRLYEYARKGQVVERKTNRIEIFSYEIVNYHDNLLQVNISCSKGTYIRSLAHDLGIKLGVPMHCKELRRTAIGDYNVNDSLNIEHFLESIEIDNVHGI